MTGFPAKSSAFRPRFWSDEIALSIRNLYALDPTRFGELTERIARHRADIEAAEYRWLEVAEMAEALER